MVEQLPFRFRLASGLTRRALLGSGARLTLAASMAGLGTRAASAAEELQIAWVLPQTGPLASSYLPHYLPAAMAMQEINDMGGILGRKLVAVKFDDEGSPSQEPAVWRQIVNQGIHYAIGPVGSSQALAALEVATPGKVIMTTYTSADLLADGIKYPYHYQISYGYDASVQCNIDCLATLNIKNVGLLMEDSAAGSAMQGSCEAQIPKRGMKVVSVQTFPPRSPDMTPFLRKLRSDGAQALAFSVSNQLDVTQFLVGLSRIGWKPPVVSLLNLLYAGVKGAIPDSARYPDVFATTLRALTYSDADPIPERVKAYAAKLVAEPNIPDATLPVSAGSPYYDFFYFLKTAAEKARSLDPDAVKTELDHFDGDGIFGRVKYTKERHSGYGVDSLAMAVVNSVNDPISAQSRGLFRRRGPG